MKLSFLLLDLHFLNHQTNHNFNTRRKKKKKAFLFFGNDNSHRSFKSIDLHFRKIITTKTTNWPSDLYKARRFEEMRDVRMECGLKIRTWRIHNTIVRENVVEISFGKSQSSERERERERESSE